MSKVKPDVSAAIVGAALSECGRVDDRTEFDLHHQAITGALADAGLTLADVDGLCSTGTGMLAPIEIAEYLGISEQLRFVESTTVGGSTWEFMLRHAIAAVSSGLAEVIVLSYASTTRSDLKHDRRPTSVFLTGHRGPPQFDVPFGHTLIAKYAMSARRHMADHGTTIEQLAQIAVDARANAADNPDAFYRDPISLDDVADSPTIADPLTKLHCCIRSDGGGAIVVTGPTVAQQGPKAPVWVLGTGEAVSHTTLSEWPDITVSPCVRSGAEAFGRAGVGPDEIDVCQLYDSFTITVLMTLEGLGFCKVGDGGPFVEAGRLRIGGALPTNTDGGGLSACHPGMRGMFLLVEATRQLRDECGPRQVPDAKLACVNGTGGWFSSASTAVLGV